MDTNPSHITLTLASTPFVVGRLSLRQSRAIGIGVFREGPAHTTDAFDVSLDRAIEIVAAALSRNNPELTPEKLLDMDIGVREVHEACQRVLEFSGFVKPVAQQGADGKGDQPQGEGQPGAA